MGTLFLSTEILRHPLQSYDGIRDSEPWIPVRALGTRSTDLQCIWFDETGTVLIGMTDTSLIEATLLAA